MMVDIKQEEGGMGDAVRFRGSKYWIYMDGSVYSEYRNKIVKPEIDRGYMRHRLRINKKIVRISVHQMLAECHVPNPYGYPIVRHLNDDKTDNSISNLAWGNASDNMMDAAKNGKWCKPVRIGSRSNRTKLHETDVLNIRNLHGEKAFTAKELAVKYGLAYASMRSILNRRTWKHI